MDAIQIEVVYEVGSGEEIGLYADGHHDPAAFAAAVETWMRDEEEGGAYMGLDPEVILPVRLDEVRHETWRDEDEEENGGYVFLRATPGEPGAYSVTCFAFEGADLAAPACEPGHGETVPASGPASPPSSVDAPGSATNSSNEEGA